MKSKTQILNSLISFSFMINSILAQNPTSPPYVLNCGAISNGTDSDGRKWSPDANFLNSSEKPVTAEAQFQDPALPSPVPYMTARIFKTPSSYIFPVSPPSRLWLRLHFYPSKSKFPHLHPSDAYFSVVTNNFTLLKNFNPFIIAKAYIIREFSLPPVISGNLNVTFLPSKEHKRSSFAFINGIEVIPMPDIFNTVTLVGFNNQSIDVRNSSLQTMVRLNVGGHYIPASKDSGLTRTWYDDSPYIFGTVLGVTSNVFNENVTIKYTADVPMEIAPVNVYTTSRSMGGDFEKGDKRYNLTWVFEADADFTYVLRFHFCEDLYSRVNQRVFDIFINNHTAEVGVDVIALAGSRGLPVYKDFAIHGVKDQIWVAMAPAVRTNNDTILNGLEIFKANDSSWNLAGQNPVAPRRLSSPRSSQVIEGVAGGMAGCAVTAVVVIVASKKRKRILQNVRFRRSRTLPLYGLSSATTSTVPSSSISSSSHWSAVAAGLCRHFSLSEIRQSTKNFDESYVIGVGGFGKVYKGVIDGGTKVAIKRSNPFSEQGANEFQTEIEMLSKLRHEHLVSLIGFCEEEGEMILVYDFMANGTLKEHLYDTTNPLLSWKQRLDICIGAARGLHYLHTGARYKVIHRDVKTTNILLDQNWVAKVSDFGLSKTGEDRNRAYVSTVIKGSFGYLDPEYFRSQTLTEKSDVYSFGVVLFEVLCARPALNITLPREQVNLADWARICQRKGTVNEIIDPQLKGKINPECVKTFADMAEKCLGDCGIHRPSMGDVVQNLELALLLQDNPEEAQMLKPPEINQIVDSHSHVLDVIEENPAEEEAEADYKAIFQQLVKKRRES